MRTSPLVAALSVLLCACGSALSSAHPPTPSPQAQHGQITVGGHVRTYALFRPESLDSSHSVSLVVVLHPCESGADRFAAVTHFGDLASSAGFVAVFPDGLANFGPGFADCWNEFLDPTKPDDLGFISQLMDRLTADLPIDRHRIFVAGQQSGGHMAYTLACAVPERLGGIASVSGGMPLDDSKASMRCTGSDQSTPVSVMEMHGTADDFIPYDGRGPLGAPPTLDLMKYWATVDRCSSDAVITVNGITQTSLWTKCRGATVVRLDTVNGGHSTWFGSPGAAAVPGEPNATAAVWNFFKGLNT